MGLSTVTFTMRNEGFRSQYVAPYSKAILVTAVLERVLKSRGRARNLLIVEAGAEVNPS